MLCFTDSQITINKQMVRVVILYDGYTNRLYTTPSYLPTSVESASCWLYSRLDEAKLTVE